jgi:hypothetical protein
MQKDHSFTTIFFLDQIMTLAITDSQTDQLSLLLVSFVVKVTSNDDAKAS